MSIYESCILMYFAAALGGFVQSITGFGAGIMMMVFIPMFMDITGGAAVSSLISLPLVMSMMWTYRKYIIPGYVLKPMGFYILTSTVAILLASGGDFTVLSIIFGIFLIILSIYFLFFSSRINIKASWLSAGVCGSISGTASGLFGIGGPPMVLYYMALTGGEKYVYLGNIQAFFFTTTLYNTILRIISGIFTLDMVPLVLVGIAGSLSGKFFGTKVVNRLNADVMKKLIYGFLAVSGIINILKSL